MHPSTDLNDQPPRFILGIDLGTTNCSAAFVDTALDPWTIEDLPIPQLTAPGTVESRDTLPSFHYQPAPGELTPDHLRLPWHNAPADHIVGLFAREHGAGVPGRLISSAKSWLCHPGVDRSAPLLPWHAAPDVHRLSPVDVSARYLAHLRAAWDAAHPDHPAAAQDVVLTVPASFDEVARELTVEAARRAGFVRLTLVEEPQAAFYAWIHAQGDAWDAHVKPGQKILVCDIGGGTTDFTLIRVAPGETGRVIFHRIAVGQHLLLGGDNLDLALAHHIERKAHGDSRLAPREWGTLLRSARAIKETFLGDHPPDSLHVNIAASSARLIGAARQVPLSSQEVRDLLLDGFLPAVALEDKPAVRRSGFQEFSLPYAADPAITRYLAAFLTAHRGDHPAGNPRHDPARPDIVLFNGGFFASPLLRDRLLEVLSSWFPPPRSARPWKPRVLKNDRLDLAVSRGAAYYGIVRRGRGVRIAGGLAHSYYVGVQSRQQSPDAPPPALCLLPAGVEEGHDVRLPQTFDLIIRQPVEFPLYISATRTTDAPGALVPADPEQLTPLPPIRTVLHSGRKTVADTVSVSLHARLTEIGTLELWAQEVAGDRRWKLDFDVRSAADAHFHAHAGAAEQQGVVDAAILPPAQSLIREAFAPLPPGRSTPTLPAPPTPQTLVKRLELLTGLSRHEWPASLMRSFWEALIDLRDQRAASVDHEARWLNLTGFCLRPGYGLAVDDWRVAQTWRIFPQKVAFPKNELCRAEWWILWRRLAGGLTPGQQLTLAEPLVAALKSRLRPAGPIAQSKTSPFQYGPHESAEVWRLLGSLEHLPLPLKEELGALSLDLLPREKSAAVLTAELFAIGRLGSRVPVYGPLNALISPETAEQWIDRLLAALPSLRLPESVPPAPLLFPFVQLARRTDDRYRDVSDAARQTVAETLSRRSADEHFLRLVREGGELEASEQQLAFGEALPRGLMIP